MDIINHSGIIPNIENHILIISIDPGIKNFCWRIEQREYGDDVSVKGLHYEKLSVKEQSRKESIDGFYIRNDTTIQRLYQHFDSYKQYISMCHYVLIEKQMKFNNNMNKLSQAIIGYFLINCDKAAILEVNSRIPKRVLNLTKKQVPQWAIKLLTERDDQYSLEILNNNKKKDDLADVVAQIEALFVSGLIVIE